MQTLFSIIRTVFYFLLFMLALLIFLCCTSTGLHTLVFILQPSLLPDLRLGKVEGNLINGFEISDLDYQQDERNVKVKRIWVDLDIKVLTFRSIKISRLRLIDAELKLAPDAEPIIIDAASLGFAFQHSPTQYQFYIDALAGRMQGQPLRMSGGIEFSEGTFYIHETHIHNGHNVFDIKPLSDAHHQKYTWKLSLFPKTATPIISSGQINIDKNTIDVNFNPHPLTFHLSNHKTYKTHYQGHIQCTQYEDKYHLSFTVRENTHNTFQGELSLQAGTLDGKIEAWLKDLNIVYLLFPPISRLNAEANISGKISGSLQNPQMDITGRIQDAIFSIPGPHITFKNVNVHVQGHLPGKLNISTEGTLGGEPFEIKGFMDTFVANPKSKFKFKGENLRIYNTKDIYINASPDIDFEFLENKLITSGSITIGESHIFMNTAIDNVVISKDVVFIDNRFLENSNNIFEVVPDIYLVIDKKLHFKGHGLDAIMGGKIQISKRNDGLYAGLGSLTIRQGTYRLPGASYGIHRGRLLYPPGTLLMDPLLDIRVSQKKAATFEEAAEAGIYVQGSLQKPQFHLYSSDHLQQSEIISRLGFGGNEGEKQAQVLSQTALFLTGGNSLIQSLQSRLAFEEFGIQSRQGLQRLNTKAGTDSALVIGKSLTDKIYLQFWQGMLIPSSMIRIRYLLNPYFAVGLETGTLETAADLSFSVEKD